MSHPSPEGHAGLWPDFQEAPGVQWIQGKKHRDHTTRDPFWGELNKARFKVILRDFPCNGALFGLVL